MKVVSYRNALRAGAAIAALTWSSLACAQTRSFDIPAEDAVKAIPEFARQAGIQIVAPADVLRGVKTPQLRGALDVHSALNQLLAGTGIVVASDDGQTIVLRVPAKNADAAPVNGAVVNASSDIETVTVTAQYQFLGADTSGTTNLPLPIEKVPQSISLVSGDFIKAADLKTLGDIASYTPGAISTGNQENAGSDVKLRGFLPGAAIDGVNVLEGTTYYEPDYAIFERLEVVKGPSSVVYGISSPGGVINYVTKGAGADTPSYLLGQVGSWDSYRLEGQLAGPLNASGSLRAIGVAVYDQGDSFTDFVHHKKAVVYGGLNFDLSDTLSGYIHGGYEYFSRTSFDGIPTEPDGSPAPVSRSFFIGSKNVILDTRVYHAEGSLTWAATNSLDFSLKSNFERASSSGAETYGSGLQTDGSFTLNAARYKTIENQNYGVGGSSIWRLDEFGLQDSFVSAALLYQDNDASFTGLFPGGGTANLADGDRAISDMFDVVLQGPFFPYSHDVRTKDFTGSLQAVVQPITGLSLLGGVSYSKPKVTVNANGAPGTFNFPGRASYRAGVTYEFLPQTTAYVSYSQSFEPQAALDINNNVLPPLTGEQYETGVKYRSDDGKLLLTGALYQISEKNVAEYDQTVGGIDYYRAVGEVRHRGVELQAIGQITDEWQVNAGYALLLPKITSDSDPLAVGKTELFLPKNTFSLYSTYALNGVQNDGLSLGVGYRFVDSVRTSYDGSTKNISSYQLVDASISYRLDSWMFSVNAHNIFNERYFINNYQTLYYGNMPGAPANFSLSIRHDF